MPKTVQKLKERDGIFPENTNISNPRRALDLASIGLPKGTHSVRPPLSSYLRLCISHVYLHLNHEETHSSGNPTPTAFTLLFCKSLVENEAEKAKSDYDPPSSFQPIRFLLIHRPADNGGKSVYTSEHKPLQGREI